MSIDFNVDVQDGIRIAAKLLGYEGYLESSMHDAMYDIVEILANAAVGNMHWKNPTGVLEASIFADSRVIDNWNAEVGSSLPYAARREWGFSGKTDSLGRYYEEDPGAYYLTNALGDHQSDLEDRINYAVQSSVHRLSI